MGAASQILQAGRPALVQFDGTDCVGFARVLRAVLAFPLGRADAADEIEPGVELRWQIGGHLTLADTEVFTHGALFRAELYLARRYFNV